MVEEFEGDIPCSSVAVDSIIRFATAGTIWGLCIGPYDGRKKGLAGIARSSFVVRSAGKYGLQSGLFAGVFSTTRCGIQRYRRQKDWVNACIAGGVAGAAFAARTRSWIQVFGMAALMSTICSAADYSNTRSLGIGSCFGFRIIVPSLKSPSSASSRQRLLSELGSVR
ncbi:hypothetical protein NE237_015347 [Protea cynaroides]|uniref:Uncharacterized protein n=1 Tax=Protea cynaroides TaxID=273540 RepID=A0A9Q0KE29_9MAGN|nr:hypothetical protein NE237_015347 [Protea cynaroides]